MKTIFTSVLALAMASSVWAGNGEGEKDKTILSANAPAFAKENYNADSTWKWGGIVGINFGQVAIGDYWAAGGLSNYSLNSLFSLYANKKKGKFNWDTNLDLAYGIIKQGERGNLGDIPWIKSDDKLEFNSKAGYQINKQWFASGLINFRSQLAPGLQDPYNTESTLISNFLAPGYLIIAPGLDWKPNGDFSLFLSPATARFTFVNDQNLANAGQFGVDAAVYDTTGVLVTPGSRSRFEFGGYLKAIYKKDNLSTNKDSFLNGVSFRTSLDLFSNYLAEKPSGPQNIDVNWEVLVGMKVNKYITATITTQLIYDHDINFEIIDTVDPQGNVLTSHLGPRTQFKEALQVGLSYKF